MAAWTMAFVVLAFGCAPVAAQTQVQNTAQASLPAGIVDPDPGNNSGSATVDVHAVALAKAASPASGTPVAIGATIDYTITATVTGGGTTSAPVLVADTLDPGLQPVAPLPAGCVQNGSTLECTIPAGTSGTYTIDYSATVTTGAGTSVGNSVAGGDDCTAGCSTSHPVHRGVVLTKAWVDGAAGDSVALTIGGTGVTGAVAGSSTPGGSTTPATATAEAGATVTVAEAFTPAGSAANYATTLSCARDADGGAVPVAGGGLSGSFTMPADSAVTCTVTNTRLQATLRLDKTWANARSGETATVSSSGFTNNASTASTSSGDNTTTGTEVTVFAGETGTISETLSNAGDYDATLACTNNSVPLSGNSLTIGPADTEIVCTQTNARRSANLVLEKQWVSAAVGEQVQFSASGGLAGTITLDSTADSASEVDAAAPQPVFAGETLTLAETFAVAGNDANYQSVLSCSNNANPLSGNELTISPSDTTITCRYVNTRRQATLQLRKVWDPSSRVNDVAQLAATTGLQNNTSAFTSTATTASNSSTVVVYAGEQATLPAETMSGGALANYGVAVACSGGSLSGTDGKAANTLDILDTDEGQPIVCTYTNSRFSTTLQLVKTWINGRPGDVVELVASDLGNFSSAATGGATQTTTGPEWTAYAGSTIDVVESFGTITSSLYDITLDCTNTAGLAWSPADPVRGVLTVGPDDGPIVCTFVNDRVSAELVVRKVWAGGGPPSTVSIPASTGFTNNSTAFTSTSPDATQVGPFEVFGFETGQLGAESFTTGNPADYTSTLSCDGTDTDPSDGLSIAVADAGNTITCTYSNTFVQRSSINVDKTTPVTTVSEVGDEIPYTITVTNDGNVPLTDVEIDDPLVQGGLVCTPALPIAELAPGASATCTATYVVTQADIDRFNSGDGSDDDFVTNTVEVTGTDPDGTDRTDQDSTETRLPNRDYEIAFTKNASLVDTNGNGTGSAGEQVSYSFTVTNNGNATIDAVSLVDPLLPGLTCDPIGTLAPGQSVTIGTQPPADVACTGNVYTITQEDIDNRGGGDNNLDNSATGTITTPDCTINCSGDATASVPLDPPAPQILLDKSASPGQVDAAGEIITYTFSVTNIGNVTIEDIEVTDPMAGLGPISCSPAAPFDLAPGAVATCTASYTVTQADIDSGQDITNTATAAGDYDGNPVTDSDSETVDVNPGPAQPQLIKLVDKLSVAQVGETLTYSFVANNPSAVTLENVRITNDTLLGASLVCDPIPSLAPGANVPFTCTGNTYQVQQSDIDNQGNPVADSGWLTNVATAEATYESGTGPVTASDTDSRQVRLPIRAPGLFLNKISSVASVSAAGQTITYTFEVQNTGNTTLTDVRITDSMLPALDCPPIASLAPGTTQQFAGCTGNIYTVTQNDIDTASTDPEPGDGQLDNFAVADALVAGTTDRISNPDTNEVNLPIRNPAILLAKQADTSSISTPGTVNYSFRVTNNGNVTLNDVTVTDAGIGLSCPTVSLAPGQVVVFGGAASGPDVVCTGTTRDVTQADIDALATIDNSAVASGTTVPGQVLNATSTLAIPVVKNRSLQLAKSANPTTVVLPGDVITYTVTGTNNGNITLENVSVSDPLVPGLACTPSIPIATLAPGTGFTCTGTYPASQADFDTNGGGDQDIDNTATATWTGGSTSASASVGIPLPTQSLTIVKTAEVPTINLGTHPLRTDAGDQIVYTFVVTNTGNQTLSLVAVNDPNLDAPATCDKTTLTASGPDSVATCTGVHTITQGEIDSGLVHNSATASGTPPASARVTSPPSAADVVLVQEPSIELAKTAGAPTVAQGALPAVTDAGDTVTFSFTVTNTGNVTVQNIAATDPLLSPPGIACPPVQLAPGDSVDCSDRTYVLLQSDIDAGTLANTATATATTPSGGTVSDQDDTSTPLPAVPGLTLAKTVLPTTVAVAGQTVTYSFAVTNGGNVTITGLRIVETAFSGSGAHPVVTCPVTTLAPGAATTCTGTYQITQIDIDNGQVSNEATANGTPPSGPEVVSNVDDAVVTVNQAPALTLVKTASPTTVTAVGQTVSYTFAVTNNGNVTIDDLAIDETAFGGAGTPLAIDCPVATLAPTQSTNCTATYAIVQADLDAGQVANTATATGTDPGDAPVTSAPASALVTATQSPALTLDKTTTATGYDSVGDLLPYSYLVTNSGNVTITGAITVDDDRIVAPNSVSCPALPSGGLAPGDAITCTATHVVSQADLDAGSVVNVATATDGSTVSPPDSETVDGTQAPALELAKTASPTTVAAVGDTVAYTFEVTNTGNVTVDSLSIVETDFGGNGTVPVATCPATPLAPGDVATCNATYAIVQADLDAGQVANIATANAIAPGSTPVASPPDDALVTATQSPALSLDKTTTATGYDSVGDLLPYSYLVTNSGNVTITGAITVDDDRIVAPNSVSCPALPSGGLAPGDAITCTATHVVSQADLDAGSVVNVATATDGSTVSPPDTETVDGTQIPAIVLDKTATLADSNGDGVVGDAGDTITYAFSVENTGNVVLAPVTVTDPLLPGLSCTVDTLAPGDTASCAATGNAYVITTADEAAGSVVNTATATGDAPGNAPDAVDDDTETTPTQLTPAVTSIVKTAEPPSGSEVAPGDTITYTVTATVADASLHEPVTLTDTLGDGLTFVAVTSAGAFSCNAANPLVCTLPAGTAPGSYPLVYTATVDADATGSVGNSVVADKPPGTDPDPVCSSCDTDHTVVPSTSTVSKTSTPASTLPVNPGTLISYTVTTVVAGSVTTEDITLADTLDPGLTFVAVTSAGIYSCSGALTCVLPAGTLPGSYDFAYTATVDADASGSPRNVVVPSNPPGGDAEPTCTVCDTVHPVSRPSITLEKEVTANDDADGNGEVSVGDTLTYGVTATNTGNVPLANVTIDDPITTPDSVTCALVPAGGTCQLVATYTVTQADADAGQVLNTATVQTEAPPDVPPLPPQACPAGSTDPACSTDNVTPVVQRPAIATTKTAVLTVDNATPGKGNIGDVVTYTVNATNTGNVTLTGVTVTDTFQGGTPVTLSCAPATLAPRQTATCDSYEHVITEDEVHSDVGLLLNTVLAQGDAGLASGTVQVTANAAAQVEVQNEPAELYLTKVAGARQVNIGDLVRYTLTLQNTGEIDLVDGYIIDTTPLGFSYVEGSIQGADDDNFVSATGSSPLRIGDLDIAAGNTATITYLMRVGAGVRPGVQINRAVAFDPAYEGPASNVATAEVVLGSDPLLDESLISGTVFNDRDRDGWQDAAALTGVRVQGGFAPGAYVPGSTTIDRGDGPQAVADASAPLLRGIAVGRVDGRQSRADPSSAHEVVIRQRLREPAFTDDFVLTSAQGATVRMAADGSTTLETRGDAAKGLTAAAPTVQRQVAQTGDGYQVDYVVRNEGIDERGIPGVRLASVEGLLVETDQYGRYHLIGIDAGQAARGRNFVLKLDTATLPRGSTLTTENPKVRRITGGVPTRFDFGVALPEQVLAGSRQVEMEIGAVLFAPGSAQVQERYLAVVDSMVGQVRDHGGGEVVVTAGGETEALALARAGAVKALLDERLDAGLRDRVSLSVRADPDDPASLVAGLGEGGVVLGTLLFDTDRATINPRFDPVLDEVARLLAASGGETIAIIGHADRRASREYNAALGLRRAKAVYEALAQRLPPEVRARLTVEVQADPDAPLQPPVPREGTP